MAGETQPRVGTVGARLRAAREVRRLSVHAIATTTTLSGGYVDRNDGSGTGRLADVRVGLSLSGGVSPRFQLRPIHREVFVREQPSRPRVGLDRLKERGRDLARQQAVVDSW